MAQLRKPKKPAVRHRKPSIGTNRAHHKLSLGHNHELESYIAHNPTAPKSRAATHRHH